MPIFTNQATLSYGCTITNSNVTEGELLRNLTITKTAVPTDYSRGEAVTYIVTLAGNGVAYTGVQVTDNLGNALQIPGGAPLEYVAGSILYYVNGVLQPAPTVTVGDGVSFSGIDIPMNGTVTLVYAARVTCCAPLSEGSTIVNTVTATATGLADEVTATAEVTVRSESALTLAKAICPDAFTSNDQITYTLILQNSGNKAVVATDNVVISDVFTPALRNITVTLNGVLLTEGVDYLYNEATGEFSTTEGAITVPAATFEQSEENCIVTVTPGVSVLTVKGTI